MAIDLEERRKWDLTRLNSGEYAALRSAAGSAELNVPARRAFYKVDHLGQRGEEQRFYALCMSCLWRPTDEYSELPMQECLKYLCRVKADGQWTIHEGMARRVDALLETPSRDKNYFLGKLLNLVKLIKSDVRYRHKPDFEALAEDLQKWDCENRKVQRKWLRTIYQQIEDEKDGEETSHVD